MDVDEREHRAGLDATSMFRGLRASCCSTRAQGSGSAHRWGTAHDLDDSGGRMHEHETHRALRAAAPRSNPSSAGASSSAASRDEVALHVGAVDIYLPDEVARLALAVEVANLDPQRRRQIGSKHH